MLPTISLGSNINTSDSKKLYSSLRSQVATLRDGVEEELSHISYEQLDSDLKKRIEAIEKGLLEQQNDLITTAGNVSISAKSLKIEVKRATDAEGELSSTIEQTAEAISSKVSSTTFNSYVEQTDAAISAKVSSTGGTSSSFSYSLTATGFTLTSSSKTVFNCTSSGVEINGKVTATSGKIGGFNIGDSSLYSGTNKGSLSYPYGVYLGTDGIAFGNTSAVTSITDDGVVTIASSSGSITLGGTTGNKMQLDKDGISFGISSSWYTEVTPSLIRASSIKTATSGARVELSSSGVSVYGTSYSATLDSNALKYSSSNTFKIQSNASSPAATITMTSNTINVKANTLVRIGGPASSGSGAKLAFFDTASGATVQSVSKASTSASLSSLITVVNNLLTALNSYGLIKSS